jgi:hypothetical protein
MSMGPVPRKWSTAVCRIAALKRGPPLVVTEAGMGREREEGPVKSNQ